MSQRRFLVGRIEEPDSYTMSEVDIALSDSVHKAVEYVLQRLMIAHTVHSYGNKLNLEVTDVYGYYVIIDLHELKQYEFIYYNSESNLAQLLESLINKHKEDEGFKSMVKKIRKDCRKEITDGVFKTLFVESYMDMETDIQMKEEDTKKILNEFTNVINMLDYSSVKIL